MQNIKINYKYFNIMLIKEIQRNIRNLKILTWYVKFMFYIHKLRKNKILILIAKWVLISAIDDLSKILIHITLEE